MSAETRTAADPGIRRDGKHRRDKAGRVLRILGILCLAGAVGVGGYLAWLLWGTGLTTKRHQSELRREFEPSLDSRPIPQTPEQEPVHLPGDAVAILVIPQIDVDVVIVEGTDTESLKRGPGHYTKTAYPWQDRGRVAIAGHRTTYGAPFWSLDKLRPGDRIILQTEYGTFRYEVTRSFIIVPSNDSVLDQTTEPTLVLTTCNPRFSAAQRLIVVATRL